MELTLAPELRPLAGGQRALGAAGTTLREALEGLRAAHGALLARIVMDGQIAQDVDILLGGRDLRLCGGLRAPLSPDASVDVRLLRPEAVFGGMERYIRQVILSEVGALGQLRLRRARVLVVGAGGLGAPVLSYLAAAGVGHLGIVDGDRVERSNLHRQPIYRDGDVGERKADVARRALLALNPDIEVDALPVYLTATNALGTLRGYDLVVNGSDNFPTRYLVSDAATLLGLPWIDGSILRFEGQAAVYLPGGGCYRCLFPTPPPPGSVPSCAEAGVIGALAGQVGAIQALEAVKLILGAGESLAGRLLVVDALFARQKSFPIRRDPLCPVCGDHPTQHELVDYEAFCGAPSPGGQVPMLAPITAQEAEVLLRTGCAQWLDVRPASALPRPTIPGAVQVPLEEVATGDLPFDQDREIVAFCDIGQRSRIAADLLGQRGYRARSLEGGIVSWHAAGLPLEEVP